MWKSISKFKLRDETFGDDAIEFVKEVAAEDVFVDEEEIDENNHVVNAILILQAINEQPLFEDKMKNWSSMCWPSNLLDLFKQSREKAELQLKIANDAFQVSQPIPPPIPVQKLHLLLLAMVLQPQN